MVKLSDKRVALMNLPVTLEALEDLEVLIELYSKDLPGPAYCTFTESDNEVHAQISRPILVTALKAQRQQLVDYLATLGIEA